MGRLMFAKRPPLSLFQVQTAGGVYSVESVMDLAPGLFAEGVFTDVGEAKPFGQSALSTGCPGGLAHHVHAGLPAVERDFAELVEPGRRGRVDPTAVHEHAQD